MPRRTTATEQRDLEAYVLRHENGMTWHEIASQLGMTGESVARTAAQRHQRRFLTIQPTFNQRRSEAGRYAALRRFGRTTITTTQIAIQHGILDRTFGVEIEFKGIPKRRAAEIVAEALGVAHVHMFPYHATERTGSAQCQLCQERVADELKYAQWKVESDGSVTSYREGGVEYGGEVVSPVLTINGGGLDQITKVVTALRNAGAKVDKFCGLHVHIGVKDLTGAQRANIVTGWEQSQRILNTFVARSRWRNRFCYHLPTREARELSQEFATNNAITRNDITVYGHSKYRSLNLMPFPKIGTFEVRLHQGTLNATKIKNWVHLLLSMFHAAANQAEFTADVTQTSRFFDVLQQHGTLTPSQINWFQQRAATLNP
jgi:hypothetical protein